MAWSFADSFDLYTVLADAFAGYWDSGAGTPTFVAGRFTGSQALHVTATSTNLTKSSGQNDAVHHIVVAFRQTAAITGTTLGLYLQLFDGATGQCAIVFRSDGAILLTSGTAAGTVLATYTGAVGVINTWYAFECEVVINNTTGSFKVRKNGNTSDDFSLGSLNTRVSANNYANKLTVSMSAAVNAHEIDDLFWQSSAAAGTWLGDIRSYTRMPAFDSSVQFSRSPSVNTQTPFTANTTAAVTNGTARYTPFTAAYDGTIGTAAVSFGTGYTGNLKCSIFASSGSAPTTVLGSATVVVNPAAGSNVITFGSPVTVTKGTAYYIGFDSDTTSGTWSITSGGTTGFSSATAYASFPAASPSTSAAAAIVCALTITVTTNNSVINEPQENSLISYVYDSTAGHVDLYTIATIASPPATIYAVTTRAYMQKSDAGSRTASVQIKSGATTVASSTLTLTNAFQWTWRMDTVDPNTSAAWAAAAVDSCIIGPKVVS